MCGYFYYVTMFTYFIAMEFNVPVRSVTTFIIFVRLLKPYKCGSVLLQFYLGKFLFIYRILN